MPEQFYTVKEVAEIVRVHVETVRRWCEEGKLPGSRKFGHRWRIPKSALEPSSKENQEQKAKQ